MRLMLATLSMLLGAAMLLPAGTALPVFAQAAPSASVEPSGSPLPDAVVELSKHTELDPAGDWAITVTGGSPSVDAVTIPDSQCCGHFIVTIAGASATVEMTAILATGSRLTSGTCRRDGDYPDEEALVAPDRLVLEVVPGGSYECSYRSEAPDTDQSSAEIIAQTIIDADGNLDTVDDQTGGEGWEFELELADGTIDEEFPRTNSEGLAGWLISFGPGGTSATLTEVVQGGFELLDASCTKIADGGDEPVGQFDGDSITFRIAEGEFATYQCSFVNVRSGAGLGLPTVPPTHAATDSAVVESAPWQLVLVGLAALIASLLVLESREAAPRRH